MYVSSLYFKSDLILWNSAQYAAAEWAPCRIILNFLLATSLESASPKALLMAVLIESQVVYTLFPSLMDGSVYAQALPLHWELA
jgi:uncharacterized membrane protein YwaF